MSKFASSFAFSYLPLIFRLKCEKDGKVPPFLGSALRGILGWTLLKSKSDVYQYLFDNNSLSSEKAHLVKPYLIEPPRSKELYSAGEEMQFSFILLGEASIYAPEVIRVLIEQELFGIGGNRTPFKLVSITHGITLQTIWDSRIKELKISNMTSSSIFPEKQSGNWASIQLQTPLRIRRRGNLVTDLDFSTLIRNITTRMKELTERYEGTVDSKEIKILRESSKEIQLISSATRCYEMERYSNKLNGKMDFTGIIGNLTFKGDIAPFTPWLNAARLLHLGRNTTFGCGKIEVVIV